MDARPMAVSADTMQATVLTMLMSTCLLASSSIAREYHVATTGNDSADGSAAQPLRTIQAAANLAMPGDTITVHEGTYRERIDPPRGGESDAKRIIYQAAPGAKVAIKGSEVVKGWTKVNDAGKWKVAIPNSFFGSFNPYADEIRGDWFQPKGRKHHTGAVYHTDHWVTGKDSPNIHWLTEAAKPEDVLTPAFRLWFATVDAGFTTITADFGPTDPNSEGVEINVRQTVFYPGKTGRNFITVRGFTLEHAATNWAPPTAEQIGLIGTNWSKGWIIENNTIRYSTCTGVTLGKHGDKFDNTSANSAEGYVETIKRGLAAGWSKENIGHHTVRGNRISHCEQAGIVGSLGAAFSTISGNHIHDIHIRQLFGGAEQAGIKIHAAIDTLIEGNHVHHCNRGIWLDWMAQGTRVTRNALHNNKASEDLFVEVNHGPFLIDHNLFFSRRSLADWSQGGTYAHNLFGGEILHRPELRRETPWLEEHGTKIAGLKNIPGGDNRFYNNLFFSGNPLAAYEKSAQPNHMAGNLFLHGPSKSEIEPPTMGAADVSEDEKGTWSLHLYSNWTEPATGPLVTSQLLGKTLVSGLPFVQPDGSAYRLDKDFHGAPHNNPHPSPGPFQTLRAGTPQTIQVWPRKD